MYTEIAETCIAFDGNRLIAKGEMLDVVRKVKALVDKKEDANILMFDGVTSMIVELDLRGAPEDVIASVEARLQNAGLGSGEQEDEHRGPGRPKLGVIGREITLLPRHWEWLETQPGSASVTLRKLVEEAKKRNEAKDRIRSVQESVYRFMNAMAGDQPGFEEALRALYARDGKRFAEQIETWPVGIREHTEELAREVFGE